MANSPEKKGKQQEDGSNMTKAFVIAGVTLVIVFIVGWIPLLMYGYPDNANSFGDSFGFMNSLFSGLAFAGVILTLWMQQEELGLQRQELKETREELKRSADAQIEAQKMAASSATLAALTTLRTSTSERIQSVSSVWAKAQARIARNRVENAIIQQLHEVGCKLPVTQDGSTDWYALELLKLWSSVRFLPEESSEKESNIVRKKLVHVLDKATDMCESSQTASVKEKMVNVMGATLKEWQDSKKSEEFLTRQQFTENVLQPMLNMVYDLLDYSHLDSLNESFKSNEKITPLE